MSSALQVQHYVGSERLLVAAKVDSLSGIDYHEPFGGTRTSSYSPRVQGTAAVEFYTQSKTAYTWA